MLQDDDLISSNSSGSNSTTLSLNSYNSQEDNSLEESYDHKSDPNYWQYMSEIDVVTSVALEMMYDDEKLKHKLKNEGQDAKNKRSESLKKAASAVEKIGSLPNKLVQAAKSNDVTEFTRFGIDVVSMCGPAGALVGSIGNVALKVFGLNGPSEMQLLQAHIDKRFDMLSHQIGAVSNQIRDGFNIVMKKLDQISSEIGDIKNMVQSLPNDLKDLLDEKFHKITVIDVVDRVEILNEEVSNFVRKPNESTKKLMTENLRELNRLMKHFNDGIEKNFLEMSYDKSKDKAAMLMLEKVLQVSVAANSATSVATGILYADKPEYMKDQIVKSRINHNRVHKRFYSRYGYSLFVSDIRYLQQTLHVDLYTLHQGRVSGQAKTRFSGSGLMSPNFHYLVGSNTGEQQHHNCDGKAHDGETPYMRYTYSCIKGFVYRFHHFS